MADEMEALESQHLSQLEKGKLVQYAGRILRPCPGKETAEVHDYHDAATGVLAATIAGRAPGYISLGFPDPRQITPTPSASTAPAASPADALAHGTASPADTIPDMTE